MWTRNVPRLAVAVLLAAVAACGDDDETTEPATEFEAELSGDQEDPPVETTASGSAVLSIEGDEIVYRVEVDDLENAIVAHIHVAPVGVNGPVRMDLCGTGAPLPACQSGTGVLAEGSNGVTMVITFDSLVSAIRAGNAYVNVHTTQNQAGEIRGQITPQ